MTSTTPSLLPINTPMAAPVQDPARLHALLSAYRTCEFATVTRAGVPATWPAVCLVAPDASSIVLTTSIGFPLKAFNVRRNPRVALLFSDPTGAGSGELPQVLVQGTAACPDEIRTSPRGMEEYWSQLASRQPSSRMYSAVPLLHPVFDFYYMRLVITVTPESVTVRPPLRRGAPTGVERVAKGDSSPFGQVARRLGGYPDAVFASVADGGFPELRRVRVAARTDTRDLDLVDATDPSAPLPSGQANLLFHAHDPQIDNLRQFGAFGRMADTDGGPAFSPDRVVTITEAASPGAMIDAMRQAHRSTRGYLKSRGLERPAIPWAEYTAIYAGSKR